MAVESTWGNTEQTVIHMTFSGSWTWAEVSDAVTERNALMNSVSHPVDVIVDLREAQGMPANTLTAARNVEHHRPDNAGYTMVVGSGAFLRAMFDVFKRLSGKQPERFHMMDTIEEAYAVIASKRGETVDRE